jgi:PTH1 family peptidyl-tRNA hydrolase
MPSYHSPVDNSSVNPTDQPAAIKAIVGLGNPGQQYRATRHNAGAWLVEQLAASQAVSLQTHSKFYGLAGQITLAEHKLHLLIPTTYMNLSGKAVAALAQFYKIPLQQILVAHDELDLTPGICRFKEQGGHNGHNGLRDIIQRFANQRHFPRLRIGIGRPSPDSQQSMTDFVLSAPGNSDKAAINQAIEQSINYLPLLLAADQQGFMRQLHSQSNVKEN